MSIGKLYEAFKALSPLVRGLVICGLAIVVIAIGSHRAFLDYIIHAVQSFPVILVLRNEVKAEHEESPPLCTPRSSQEHSQE